MDSSKRRDYLKRLPRQYYRGDAYVHWSLTIEHRRKGWLKPLFYYKFRELLAHTMFRYGLVCPIFCCMPDHIHLTWMGVTDGSDQINAMKYFRRQLNIVLNKIGFQLQLQPYDNVIEDDDRASHAFAEVCEYVARNPERKKIVPIDQYAAYPFTNCMIPGAPEVNFFDDDFWDRFWTIHSSIVKLGMVKSFRNLEKK